MKRRKAITLEELSIAGSPEKLMQVYQAMQKEMERVDRTNAAELTNLYAILRRLTAESRTWIKEYEERTGQRIGALKSPRRSAGL
ncbi:MAG: hypothetical protein ACTHMC_12365 [Pseudobacter sp.]|uniref:hypothetical protein n=1 Tax=Pseudobacter sp. TaxID=2045420 RepID=UPI003F7D893E